MEKELLKKLNITPYKKETFQILISVLKELTKCLNEDIASLKYQENNVTSILDKLTPKEIQFIESKFPYANFSLKECQIKVQKLIPQEKKKKLATYYTIEEASEFMALLVKNYLKEKKNKITISDPFIGSGRAVTPTLQLIGHEKVRKVWGVEPLPLPALIAYTAITNALNGKSEKVNIIIGDAFKVVSENFSGLNDSKLPKADIILTNPPFTRWKNIERERRKFLLKLVMDWGYKKYITRKEISLQTLCLYLCDLILKEGGLLTSVLPVSTFYTIYGKGYKTLLKNNYKTLGILESSSRASFSEGSGFKEVILAALKKRTQVSEKFYTLFSEINRSNYHEIADFLLSSDKNNHSKHFSKELFDINHLPSFLDINWLSLFRKRNLRNFLLEIISEGLENDTIGYWKDVLGSRSIVRGVEMYGPEFFFIPNKYWDMINENSSYVKIFNPENGKKITIDKKFLVRTFRRPSMYDKIIQSPVDTYMLSLSVDKENLPKDLQYYVEWGIDSGAASPAINSYGKLWYKHVYKQMITKEPFGHLVLPDKVDLKFKKRGVFANYSDEKIAASKNFYIIRNIKKEDSQIFSLWFNSTLFYCLLILLGRKISNSWTRLLKNDYLEIPLLNVNNLESDDIKRLLKIFNEISNKELDPFWDQLDKKFRLNLDVQIFQALKVKNPVSKVKRMYKILREIRI